MEPIVTVIIPAFNRESYIDITIQSVLDQNYPNVQLIVVDDGSTDGTYEKIQRYSDRLKLLTHEKRINKGQSSALNLGLAHATGKYIAILDSDDFWDPKKLNTQVDFLENNPDIGLVYSNGYAVGAQGQNLYPIYSDSHSEKNDPNHVLLNCYILLPQNSLVRKIIYDKLSDGFNENYRAAQDHDMLIRISEITKFAYIDDYLFFYRVHDDSISKKSQRLRWNNGFKILENAIDRYPYHPSTIRKRRAVLNYRLAICSFNDKQFFNTIKYLLIALCFDPLRSIKVVIGLDKSK